MVLIPESALVFVERICLRTATLGITTAADAVAELTFPVMPQTVQDKSLFSQARPARLL